MSASQHPTAPAPREPINLDLSQAESLPAQPLQVEPAVPSQDATPPTEPALPIQVQLLLRSAVALQAEDLLRTIGALAHERQDVDTWAPQVQHDVRDLCRLAAIAAAMGTALPAGFDAGTGDPEDPKSVLEGLLVSHEVLLQVLSDILAANLPAALTDVVREIAQRRSEEATVLRDMGAGEGVPDSIPLIHGALPKNWA